MARVSKGLETQLRGDGWDEFETLYERHAPAVHRRALRMLGRDAEAWDAVQEVFRAILEARSPFRGEASPMTYLYRATTNVCLNALRARALREPAQAPEPPEAAEPHATPEATVEARDLVRRLLGSLDDRGLQIATLTYLDGLGQDEIGEVLGLSRKTVGRELTAIRAAAEALAGRADPP